MNSESARLGDAQLTSAMCFVLNERSRQVLSVPSEIPLSGSTEADPLPPQLIGRCHVLVFGTQGRTRRHQRAPALGQWFALDQRADSINLSSGD